MEKIINVLVEYAKGGEWKITKEVEGTCEATTTEEGNLVIAFKALSGIGYDDVTHFIAKNAIDSINEELCGLSILDRKIQKILYFFRGKVTKEMIEKYK